MAEAQLPDLAAPDRPATALLPAAFAGPLAQLRASPLFGRAALPALLVASLAIALFAWVFLSPPDRAPLYSSLPESDKAAVVAALEDAGLSVALDPRSGAVLLPAADHARARMMLAAEGLPKAAPGSMDLLGDMPLGTSRAVEGAKLKTAQERELARSIESLQGVEAARVILATPEVSPFVRDKSPVTASVTLTLAAGRSLSESQARAIVHLVAGAVPGLSPDNVAIADQSGRLLAGEPGSSRDRADDRQLQMQARMELRARESIIALLGPIVGPENLTAQVSIDMDFAAREAAQERYERDGALRSEATQRSTSSEPRAIGIPGALTNTVPAAATVTAAPPPAAQGPTVTTTGSESATRNYELGRSVEVTSRSGGSIRRLTAAVVIRDTALGPPAQRAARLKEIETLVAGAVGFDAARGDRIAVAARPFAPAADVQVPLWQEPVVVESSKWLSAALVALGILFFIIRPMLTRLAQAPARALPAPGTVPLQNAYPPRLVDYAGKLTEARMIASTDSARATAVARRLLAEPDQTLSQPMTAAQKTAA